MEREGPGEAPERAAASRRSTPELKSLDRRVPAACLCGALFFLGLFLFDLTRGPSSTETVYKEPVLSGGRGPSHRLLFPPDDYAVSEQLTGELRFTWTPSLAGRIHIARDRRFTGLVLDEPVTGGYFRGPVLTPGTYYWRVSAGPPQGAPLAPPRRLVVVPPSVPPELEPPRGSFTGQVEEELVVILPKGRNMRFSWKARSEADYYIFRLYRRGAVQQEEIAHNEVETEGTQAETALRELLETHIVEGTSLDLSFDGYDGGPYYWSVQPVLEEREGTGRRKGSAGLSAFFLQKTRSVILEHPSGDFEISWTDLMRGTGEFRWSLLGAAGRSRFYLSRNRNPRSGRALLSINNPRRSFTMPPLSPGDYYWTIEATGDDGTDVSAKEAVRFTVRPGPPLPAARGLSPENNYAFGARELRGRATISFAWNRVAGANAYIFTLYQQGNNGTRRRIQGSGPGSRTSYILGDLASLGRGTFIWQVEAVYLMNDGAIGRRGVMAEHCFSLDDSS